MTGIESRQQTYVNYLRESRNSLIERVDYLNKELKSRDEVIEELSETLNDLDQLIKGISACIRQLNIWIPNNGLNPVGKEYERLNTIRNTLANNLSRIFDRWSNDK